MVVMKKADLEHHYSAKHINWMYWKDKRVWIKLQLLNRVWVVIKQFYPNCKRTRTKWCTVVLWWVSYLLRSWNLTPTVSLWRSASLLKAVPKCPFVSTNCFRLDYCAVAKSCKYACTFLQLEGRSKAVHGDEWETSCGTQWQQVAVWFGLHGGHYQVPLRAECQAPRS